MSQCRGSRCGGRGGGPESHRERVSRAKLALGVSDYLPACLSSFLPSFVPFLPFSVRSSSSLFRIESFRVLLSFPGAFLSFSLHDPPAFSFVLSCRIILRLSCVHNFPSSFIVHAPRFLLHSALSSLLASLPPLHNSFSPLSFHPTVSLASSFLAPSPPVPVCCLPA